MSANQVDIKAPQLLYIQAEVEIIHHKDGTRYANVTVKKDLPV